MSDKKNIYQRVLAIMAEVDYLQKDKEVANQYRAVSFQLFAAKTREALIRHGVLAIPVRTAATVRHLPSFTKKVNQEGKVWKEADAFRTEIAMTIRLVNVDDPKDFFELECFGAGIDEQDKDPGKAFTYALKNGLMKQFLVETGETEESPYQSAEVQSITSEQAKKIRELCVAAKIAEDKISGSVGAKSIEEIPSTKFEEIIVALNQRAERVKAKEASGSKKTNGGKAEAAAAETSPPPAV